MPLSSSAKKSVRLSGSDSRPRSLKLEDVARFNLQRMGPELRRSLLAASAKTGVIRVGTLCSGSDSPIAVLRAIQKAVRGRVRVEHIFSCEYCKRKQGWLLGNIPDLQRLYKDVLEVGNGWALNVVTGQYEEVPPVDLVIAGFVCKSVSTENPDRPQFANCIEEATGSTGETFSGTENYVRRYRPAMVICENVEGLTKAIKGSSPQIYAVEKAFEALDYSFGWKVLDTRDFHLPQRRRRCWMFALAGRTAAKLSAVEGAAQLIEDLKSSKPFKIAELRKVGAKPSKPAQLNARQTRVVEAARKKLKQAGRSDSDAIVDVAKSEQRAPVCLGAAPCIVPNSLPYLISERRVLSASEVLACQGIYQRDFPELHAFTEKQPTLCRDLAGNAFSSTVAMAVSMAVLSHSAAPAKKRKLA